jgi:hypothetical protein
VFNFDDSVDPSLKPNAPPLQVICIGAAKDEQTAKQTVFIIIIIIIIIIVILLCNLTYF